MAPIVQPGQTLSISWNSAWSDFLGNVFQEPRTEAEGSQLYADEMLRTGHSGWGSTLVSSDLSDSIQQHLLEEGNSVQSETVMKPE